MCQPTFIQLARWPSWSKAHGSGQPDPDGSQLSPCLERGVGSNPTLVISFCFFCSCTSSRIFDGQGCAVVFGSSEYLNESFSFLISRVAPSDIERYTKWTFQVWEWLEEHPGIWKMKGPGQNIWVWWGTLEHVERFPGVESCLPGGLGIKSREVFFACRQCRFRKHNM